MREQPAGSRAEIFWASAPDAFEVLAIGEAAAEGGACRPAASRPRSAATRSTIPRACTAARRSPATASCGTRATCRRNKLPAPKEWVDLTKPVYFGHVATSSPSRSGTTHLTFETILQGEGWDKGWNQILQIAGNCAAITERSFGVPDGVQNGQYGIGLVIDFFGLAAKASGFPVEFVYPQRDRDRAGQHRRWSPARRAPRARKRFMQFTLSEEGQQLLLDPKISRLPVLPATYAKAPLGYPNPFGGTIQAKVNFDSDLSESRYYVVLVALRPGHHLPPQGARRRRPRRSRTPRSASAAAPSAQLEEAKKLAWTPPVSAEQAQGQGAARRLQGEEGRRRRAAAGRPRSRRSGAARPRPTTRRAVELASAAK